MYQSASSTLILPFLKPSITTANSFSPFISINPKEKFYRLNKNSYFPPRKEKPFINRNSVTSTREKAKANGNESSL